MDRLKHKKDSPMSKLRNEIRKSGGQPVDTGNLISVFHRVQLMFFFSPKISGVNMKKMFFMSCCLCFLVGGCNSGGT